MISRDKGLYNLLLAACQTKCPVPFSSGIFTFPESGGDYIMFTIKDGIGRKGHSSQAYRALSPFRCEERYHFSNGRPTQRVENDELKQNMKAICDHLASQAKSLFHAESVRTDLTFGIENETKIILMGNSRLTYSTSRPKTSTHSDRAVTPKLAKQNSSTNTPNANDEHRPQRRSTAGSMSPVVCSDAAKAVRVELSRPVPRKRCMTQGSRCGPAKCNFPRAAIVFHRVQTQFPNIDEGLLCDMIKQEMKDPNERVLVCSSCYELYMEAARVCQCQVQDNPPSSNEKELAEIEPQTPVRRSPKREGSPNRAEQKPPPPNLVMSPYKEKVPMQIPEPPKPDSRPRTRPATVMGMRERGPGGERLSSLSPATAHKKFRISRGMKMRKHVTYSLPEFECPVPMSVIRAKELYSPVPFDLSILLDPRRRKDPSFRDV